MPNFDSRPTDYVNVPNSVAPTPATESVVTESIAKTYDALDTLNIRLDNLRNLHKQLDGAINDVQSRIANMGGLINKSIQPGQLR